MPLFSRIRFLVFANCKSINTRTLCKTTAKKKRVDGVERTRTWISRDRDGEFRCLVSLIGCVRNFFLCFWIKLHYRRMLHCAAHFKPLITSFLSLDGRFKADALLLIFKFRIQLRNASRVDAIKRRWKKQIVKSAMANEVKNTRMSVVQKISRMKEDTKRF